MILLLLLLAVSSPAHAEQLSLSSAALALEQAGGLAGKVFAVGNNNYLVRRARVVRLKRPGVFEVEVEIVPVKRNN